MSRYQVRVLRRRLLLLGAMSAAMASAAMAADRTITTQVTTPVNTSDASNGPGNITIEGEAGQIVVNAAGAAATVDSPHLVTNSSGSLGGGIVNNATSNAIGVQLNAGVGSGGGYTGFGGVFVLGNSATAANNLGIRVSNPDGSASNSAFSGSVLATIHPATGAFGSINVGGADAKGVLIAAPVTGDVALATNLRVVGSNAQGVVVTRPIDGSLSVLSSVVLGTAATTNTIIDPLPGSAIAIGASIGNGLLTGTRQGDSSIGLINTFGSQPAVLISPAVAGSPGTSITLGEVQGEINPANYSYVNLANVFAEGIEPGISTTALQIEGGGAGVITSLSGGIHNAGQIFAAATSSNALATTAPTTPANATAIVVGANAQVATLNNLSNIAACIPTCPGLTAISPGPEGGTATAIDIREGATLPTITNSGSISGVGSVTDQAVTDLFVYGVRDRSGTLSSIVNSGSIAALGVATATTNAFAAIDVSARQAAFTLTNSGTITGNVNFGRAANSFTIETASGATAGASAAGRFKATDSGTLDIALVTNSATQASTLTTDETDLRNLTVGAGSVVEFALNRTNPASSQRPLLAASGSVTFAENARVTLRPTSFLPNRSTYTLLTAGTLTIANEAATLAQPLPFLFRTSGSGIARVGSDLVLTLERKTALDLGLTGNAATLYEPLVAAAAEDDIFGSAFLRLENEQEVQAALATLLPNTTHGVRALAIAVTDQATGAIGARQRAIIGQPKQGLGFWAQQFYEDLNAGTTARGPSYFASGMGLALGAEWGDVDNGRMGASYTYFAGHSTERHPRSSKADIGLHMLSLYGGWRWQDFFVTPQANAGFATFRGRRDVFVGDFQRLVAADWNAYLASGGVAVGYVLNFGPLQVMPQISVDGLYMRQAAYTEAGGGPGIDINVGAQDAKSVRLFAGVVAQSGFMFEGGRVQPQLLAGWSREMMNDPAVIDASFEALPGSAFALVGPTSDPSRLIGGASFAYLFQNWSAGVNYDAAQSSGSFSQSATVNVTSRF